MVVGAAAMLTKTVGTTPPPTLDCGATLADDGLIAGDLGMVARRTTDVNDNLWGGS